MLGIQYLSDIHLEFYEDINPLMIQIQCKENILILAGDIGNPFLPNYEYFLSFISNTFEKTFIISGNHEYYYNNIEETNNKIKNIIDKFDNITFLLNSFEDYKGIRWIGTTLWTHIKNPQYTISDISKIPNLTVDKYNEMHFECVKFLEDTINDIPCIIISHHLPMYSLTAEQYKNSLYRQWFNADLDNLIKNNKSVIKAFFYGHTHQNSVQITYDIPFLCNPLGYPNENKLTEAYFSRVYFLTL
jgi:predicted phosphohydrolase